MADNTTLNSGTGGDTIATDDIGGVKYQRVKVNFGADGSATDVSTSDPLPVSDAGGSLTVDGTVTAAQATAANLNAEVQGDAAHDAAVSGNPVLLGAYAKAAAPAAVSADGDAVRLWADLEGRLQVGDGGSTLSVDDGAGSLTVDGSVSLAAALPAGTNNIGDVDVASFASGAITEVQGDVAHDAAAAGNPVLIGAYAKATAPAAVSADGDAVQLWADLSGRLQVGDGGSTLSVDDGGSSLTVDGTVSVNALPAGTNNIGDVDVLSVVPGTGATALGKAEDAAHASGDTGVYALAVRDDSPAAHSGTDGDYESLHVNAEGALWVTPTASKNGGLTIFRSLDLDETEEEVSATACTVYGWYIANLASSIRYVKFYNLTAANTTVGTSTPVLTLPLPANSTNGVAANALGALGITFDTALSVAAVTGVADNSTGAPGANEVVINLFYKA